MSADGLEFSCLGDEVSPAISCPILKQVLCPDIDRLPNEVSPSTAKRAGTEVLQGGIHCQFPRAPAKGDAEL
jgi:hypothetical protein